MEKPPDQIAIHPDNLSRYGFVCFHKKGDPLIKDDNWVREIEFTIDPVKGNRIQHFKIPSKYLIELSGKGKIIHAGNYAISAKPYPLNIIKLLSERAGWNQTTEDLNAMISYESEGIFVSTYKLNDYELPLGSGVSLPVNQSMAWIGMILVHPELRRQGIARSIMNTCLMHARSFQNKKIVGLDATPLGKQVYDSLGFKDSFTIWRSAVATSREKEQNTRCTLEPFNLDLVNNYLNRKNYLERIKIIELLAKLPDSKNLIARTNGLICGFVMSRPGRLKPFIGPLIADTDQIAAELTNSIRSHWNALGFRDVFIDIPEYHLNESSIFIQQDDPADLTNNKITVAPTRSLKRMYQLISSESELNGFLDAANTNILRCIEEGSKDTMTFMNKEKNEIVPIMYGTAGPEWS